MYILFDTETTGVPKDYKAPATDLDNWPRLVQIGWVLYDDDKNLLAEAEFVVKPEGFEIPENVSRIHGVTTEKALSVGDALEDVLEIFKYALDKTDTVIGHNLTFDENVVGAEFLRLNLENPFSKKTSVDTMKSSIDYCKLPGKYGNYKWPKLSELYFKLFNEDMGEAHTALQDIRNTAKCYFELVRLGVIA